MTDDRMIRVQDLVVDHPTADGSLRALDCHRLVIDAGSSVAVVGPSGCGKSTLISLLAGLATPTRGTVTIGATEITAQSESARVEFRKGSIGVVYQADNLLPFLTVAENVRLQLALCGDREDAQRRTRTCLINSDCRPSATACPTSCPEGNANERQWPAPSCTARR